jgi:hydrogenase maturation factor
VTGTLGDHGLAVLTRPGGFRLGEQIRSDVSPVWGLVELALAAGDVHAMKDPTRGGFAHAINDMARKSRTGVIIEEEALPVRRSVRSASEMLGIDPLEAINKGFVVGVNYVGNEFSCGNAFLPELVMAGEAMKAAVAVLEPELNKRGTERKMLGKVVLATVEGDIHEIGKNLRVK